MEVIVIESDAFNKLVDEIISRVKTSMSIGKSDSGEGSGEDWIEEGRVMKLLGIKNKAYFGQIRAKQQMPCYKVGKYYMYKRSEIETFILKHRANR
jgi:hypothetical protein